MLASTKLPHLCRHVRCSVPLSGFNRQKCFCTRRNWFQSWKWNLLALHGLCRRTSHAVPTDIPSQSPQLKRLGALQSAIEAVHMSGNWRAFFAKVRGFSGIAAQSVEYKYLAVTLRSRMDPRSRDCFRNAFVNFRPWPRACLAELTSSA